MDLSLPTQGFLVQHIGVERRLLVLYRISRLRLRFAWNYTQIFQPSKSTVCRQRFDDGASMSKLSVIVHENDEVTIKDERGLPVLCQDCRFAGWLSKWEFNRYRHTRTCLYYSGGSSPILPVRIRFFGTDFDFDTTHERWSEQWRKDFPMCAKKNHNGNCKDFIRAKPQSWWTRVFHRRRMRE